MFSLAQAYHAFAEDGQLTDAELQRRFEGTVRSFMELVEASKYYPCARRAWVEYLGDHLGPSLDRVE
jgi:hypothetical protein